MPISHIDETGITGSFQGQVLVFKFISDPTTLILNELKHKLLKQTQIQFLKKEICVLDFDKECIPTFCRMSKQKRPMAQQTQGARAQQTELNTQFPTISFGTIRIPILPPSHPSFYQCLPDFPVDNKQNALLTALWRASTQKAKKTAISAVNIYFSSFLPTYYAVFTGSKTGVFTNKSFHLVQDEEWDLFHSFSDAFNACVKRLKTTNFFVETFSEQGEVSSSSNKTLVQTTSFPENLRPNGPLLEEISKLKQETKNLSEQLMYWKEQACKSSDELYALEDMLHKQKENFEKEKQVLEAQKMDLLSELQQTTTILNRYSTEHQILQIPKSQNFDLLPFEDWTRYVQLFPRFKITFLDAIYRIDPALLDHIFDLANESFFQKLFSFQHQLAALLPLSQIGIIPKQLQKQENIDIMAIETAITIPTRECLLAHCEWPECTPQQKAFIAELFDYGMLLTITLGNEPTPSFFGRHIAYQLNHLRSFDCGCSETHYGFVHCTIQIYSDFPYPKDRIVLPAHHKLFVFLSGKPYLPQYPTPDKPKLFTEKSYYMTYTDLYEPNMDRWNLIAKTELIEVYCLHSTGSSLRSDSPSPIILSDDEDY